MTDDAPEGIKAATIPYPHIAILGRAGAGKTTGADYLGWAFDYSSVSFAGLLKQIAVMIWGGGAALDRDKLQKLGKVVRDIDEEAWVNAAMSTFHQFRAHHPVVIDDCRFPNEYWALKAQGFVFIRVTAPEEVRIDRLQKNGKLTDLEQLNHESESYVDDFEVDAEVANDGEQHDYLNALTDAVSRLQNR